MAAIYTVFTSPHHAPMPNHLPTLIVTPHGQPHQILYSYLHTEAVRYTHQRMTDKQNRVNYLLTPSPQGDLCVAKLFPPSRNPGASSSDLGHGSSSRQPNVVRCEASRELRWTIENNGVRSAIYKIVNSDDTPLYQISKPNPNADWWTMFYFAYAGHQIPPRRVEFGKVSKNPPEKGGGTRITITGKTEDEKKVWQTLGEGNEDCVEWVVCCACLNLLDDEILKAAERKTHGAGPASTAPNPAASSPAATSMRPSNVPVQHVRSGVSPASTAPIPSHTRGAVPPRGYAPPPPQSQSTGPRSAPPTGPPAGFDPRRAPPQQQPGGSYDPRRGPPPQQAQSQADPRRGPPPQQRPPPPGNGRRF